MVFACLLFVVIYFVLYFFYTFIRVASNLKILMLTQTKHPASWCLKQHTLLFVILRSFLMLYLLLLSILILPDLNAAFTMSILKHSCLYEFRISNAAKQHKGETFTPQGSIGFNLLTFLVKLYPHIQLHLSLRHVCFHADFSMSASDLFINVRLLAKG